MARMIGQKLTERLGQPVVVDNKPSASEQVGATLVAKSPAHGYTLMMATTIGLAIKSGRIHRDLGRREVEEGDRRGGHQN